MNVNEQYRSLEEALLNDLAGADPLDPAVIRLSERWDKRFVPDKAARKVLHQKALSDFIDINEKVTPPSLEDVDPIIIGEAQAFIYNALTRFTATQSTEPQSELDGEFLMSLWRFGPGSSRGVLGTHFVTKIRQSFTTTALCLPLTRLIRAVTPLIRLFDLKHPNFRGTKVVSGSRLSSVGKNRQTNRTIATEPSGNMAIQLAIGVYIQMALKFVGLDIETQEGKNKHLAWFGSITGLLCTIDLKSASDLISKELICLLWPRSWYDLFIVARSRVCTIGVTPADRIDLKLRMMSTMGNGFTFPMMTMTLLALLYGYMRSQGDLNNKRVDYSRMGVYGDDIICPVEYYTGFTELLHRMGLIVNVQKSYATGPFRESCGGDYHTGVDITPFYIESLSNDSEVYTAINKVLKWSSFQSIKLPRTILFLRSLIKGRCYLVPEWEDPSSGVLSMFPPVRYKYLVPIKNEEEKLICSDLDLLCILGGYVTPGMVEKGRRHFMTWNPRKGGDDEDFVESEEDSPTHIVKNARLPKGYRDGHDPFYTSRDDSLQRAALITALL